MRLIDDVVRSTIGYPTSILWRMTRLCFDRGLATPLSAMLLIWGIKFFGIKRVPSLLDSCYTRRQPLGLPASMAALER